MKACLKIVTTLTLLTAPVRSQGLISFGTANTCRDCCGEGISLYGQVTICVENEWCQGGIWATRGGQLQPFDHSGTRYENATFAKIFPNGVSNSIRRCTVQGFPKLDTIFAELLQLTVIERNAFWNLPNLKHIYLAFNSLKEVRYGVFSSLPVESLDLSWNEIGYISETAFKGMENLASLNLTHNRLITLDLLQVDFPLKELRASYNLLEAILINPNINPTELDLSFNKIKTFDVPQSELYKLIDLTGNYLSNITLKSGTILNLKLALNNLTSIVPLMTNLTKIKNITIFPNPFNCNDLNTLLRHLVNLKVNILKPATDDRLKVTDFSYPVCAQQHFDALEAFESLRPLMVKREIIPCRRDAQCPGFMICKNRKCWEPCSFDTCKRRNLSCQTRDHKVTCQCPPGQFLNETQLFSRCYTVCFQDEDCQEDEFCTEKNICSS